jgi:hypothetical protein
MTDGDCPTVIITVFDIAIGIWAPAAEWYSALPVAWIFVPAGVAAMRRFGAGIDDKQAITSPARRKLFLVII